MFDPQASLHELAQDLDNARKLRELRTLTEKCEDLLKASERFVPYLNNYPKDEFYAHVASVRRSATALHEDCVRFIRSDSLKSFDLENFRQKAEERWAELCDLMVFATKLKSPADTEQVCAAL